MPTTIFGAAAPVALLAAAETGATDVQLVAAKHQRANTHGAADLVRRNAQKIGPQLLDIEQDLAKRLNRIDVQQPAGGVHELGRLTHRLDHAGLVVGRHQRHQRLGALAGCRLETRLQLSHRRHAVAACAEPLDRGEVAARQHRDVLDLGGDRHIAGGASVLDRPAERERIRFRAAGGENHVARLGADRHRDALARRFQDLPGGTALGVHRRRVAHDLHGRSHGGARLRAQRRGRIPVEIGPFRHGVRLSWSPYRFRVFTPNGRTAQTLLKHLLFVPALVLKAPAATALARARDHPSGAILPKIRMVLSTYACRPVPSSAPRLIKKGLMRRPVCCTVTN